MKNAREKTANFYQLGFSIGPLLLKMAASFSVQSSVWVHGRSQYE
jgi:hypothetical protein